MRVRTYVYDGDRTDEHVEAVLDRLADRDEDIEYQDIAAAENRDDALREAIFIIKESIRIGTSPEEIYDNEGNLDVSAGILVTQEPTGRRSLHIGADALDVLTDNGDQ